MASEAPRNGVGRRNRTCRAEAVGLQPTAPPLAHDLLDNLTKTLDIDDILGL